MVHFLLDGNDMEDVDDESDQDDGYKDVNEAADIRGVSSLGQQEPFQFFSQDVTSWATKSRRDPGWTSCLRSVAVYDFSQYLF